jgi:3-deoxy-alpha-D-manno-octulosonate 8-oxidase
LSDDQYKSLYDSTVVHSKPLTNALGEDYKKTLTFDKVVELFKLM